MMLSELCRELNNYFDRGQKKFHGNIKIVNGQITNEEFTSAVLLGQYFRIVGSSLNDGVYCYNSNLPLMDETFDGSIWLMAIPVDFVELAKEIDEWQKANKDKINSPYQSESFGGYSYSRVSGGYKEIFANRLNKYRKIRI